MHATESLLAFVLLQLVIVIAAGRAGGIAARRVGQSPAVGEIIVGILLGPSLFGLVAPETFAFVFRTAPAEPMLILSQVGLLLLMFQIGLEFDFSHLTDARHRRSVVAVSVATLGLPFILGLAFGWLTAGRLSPQADPLASSLFIATAFSITALPILGRIMIEFDIARTPLGVIAISAAAVNDVVGWVLLAAVSALAAAGFSGSAFAMNLGLLAAFVLACWVVARPLARRAYRALAPRHGDTSALGDSQMAMLLVLVFAGGLATYKLGIFAIFGGFLAGVLLHDEPGLLPGWRARVGQFVLVFFLPIFFTYTGLRTEVGSLDSPEAWGWCALLVLLASAGKLGGAYLAGRWTGLSHGESCVLGVMMNTRALMELVVINVGHDLGVISSQVFTMLVIMALASTVVTTPGLRRWLPRAGLARPPA
ncbi:MAG: cation:proton antiporter [Betaproteobacteria bacterium]|nr:cation:proton antiporter [Betaproteobacteria bacterium]